MYEQVEEESIRKGNVSELNLNKNRCTLACVASVSNRVIARKLERKQKKVEGGGGGEKRKRLPANPYIILMT